MSRRIKLAIMAAVVLALAAGAYAYFAHFRPEPEPPPKQPKIVHLGEFITNLAGVDRRFVKVQVDVKADSEEAGREIVSRSSEVRDAVLLVLRSKNVTDLAGPEGMKKLGVEISDSINQILTTGDVLAVYFVEFAIQ